MSTKNLVLLVGLLSVPVWGGCAEPGAESPAGSGEITEELVLATGSEEEPTITVTGPRALTVEETAYLQGLVLGDEVDEEGSEAIAPPSDLSDFTVRVQPFQADDEPVGEGLSQHRSALTGQVRNHRFTVNGQVGANAWSPSFDYRGYVIADAILSPERNGIARPNDDPDLYLRNCSNAPIANSVRGRGLVDELGGWYTAGNTGCFRLKVYGATAAGYRLRVSLYW